MNDSLGGLATAAWDFAVATSILATFCALILQAVYDLGLRYVLNRIWIRSWIIDRLKKTNRKDIATVASSNQTKEDLSAHKSSNKQATVDDIEKQLAYLSAGGNLRVLYDLSYDRLCGQVATALQAIIGNKEHQVIIRLFAANGAFNASKTGQNAISDTASHEDTSEFQRLNYFTERGVDEFQLYLARLWRITSFSFSIFLSFSIVFILLLTPNAFKPEFFGIPLYLTIVLAAGLLAPLLRSWIEMKFT